MQFEYDFTQTINDNQLLDEISSAGLPTPDSINTADTNVQILYSTELSGDQQITLSNVVANHVANPNYLTLSLQAQINTLTGYLNSSNPTVQSIARVAIVSNIAPGLPAGLLTKINAQIAAAIGS